MSRDSKLYLQDILTASQRIATYVDGLDFESFIGNDQAIDAVLFNLMTIGEAVKNVPESMRTSSPEVAWREIARFRDLVAHHYFQLKLEIVWGIVQTDLPLLTSQIEMVLKAENS